ncbi:MAG: YraN family protein [Elusimicrobiaceae bacterium]|nr:YraN family protein [Elusimicrobiaceae bacterium]
MFSFLRRIGNKAEDQAADYLKRQGYKIIERNYNLPCGEIDIIAKKNKTLVFVEVKYRKNSEDFGGPAAAVNKAKQKKVINAALSYIKTKKPNYAGLMFDIIAVSGDKIEHIQNAFSSDKFFI